MLFMCNKDDKFNEEIVKENGQIVQETDAAITNAILF